MRNDEKASWIDTELSNAENALEEIPEKEAVVEETAQNDKKKIVPKRRKWETENSREPWRDTEKTKERWGREWNSTKSRKSTKWKLHCSKFTRKERPHAEMEDMQLQKQRLEAESKKEEQSKAERILNMKYPREPP